MSKDPFDFIKKGAKSVANFLRPDDDRTTEENWRLFRRATIGVCSAQFKKKAC